jgi:nucleotide sugar dehydrogenase
MNSIGVFGMGFVGQEVTSLALDQGFDVSAVDIDKSVLTMVESKLATEIEEGRLEMTTDTSEVTGDLRYVIISVPTPLSSASTVDLTALKSVCRDVATAIEARDNPVSVIVESTIPPGTVPEVVEPIFTDNGFKVGEDVYLAHVPERIDPGNDDWPLRELPRVVGAMTDQGAEAVCEFYDKLIDAEVHRVDSTAVAAAAKIIENAYRDINIAFVNEIALTLDQLDIDVTDALDAAATKPFGFTRFSPGAGVGGHCIPIDPYFLIEKGDKNGFENTFLKNARKVNNHMPEYVADVTIRELIQGGTLPQEATVLLLGAAFKSDVADTRNSPYFTVREKLAEYDVDLETYDPHIPDLSTVESPYIDADVVVLVTAHSEFRDLEFCRLADAGVSLFVDGRNEFPPSRATENELEYVGVGRR